jgi:hypothetical protein
MPWFGKGDAAIPGGYKVDVYTGPVRKSLKVKITGIDFPEGVWQHRGYVGLLVKQQGKGMSKSFGVHLLPLIINPPSTKSSLPVIKALGLSSPGIGLN